MDIKLPKTYKDLRIKHLKPIQTDKYMDKMDLNLMVEFIADFTGIKKAKLMSIDVKDITNLSNHIATLYASMPVVKHPPKEITLNGKTYELVNPEKIGVGWHIDWSNGDIESDPVRMACLMYYPKGAVYGEVDAYDNLVNPIKDRYKEFENHLPLSTFLEASNFFLQRFVTSTKRYTEKEILLVQARKLNPFNGKK
jgi:hypothetical protein